MSKLTEWLFGAASADGVEIDEADAARIEAALEGANPAQAEAITAMQKQLAARDSEIAELLQAKRDQEAVLATAAAEQRHTAAMSLADRLVAEKRLMPAASETFAALAEHCASLEAGLAVTASASDLLTAFAASLPDLSVFTTEHVDTEAAAALPTQEVTAIPGAPQKPSAERKAQLLKHTPLGRQALSTK